MWRAMWRAMRRAMRRWPIWFVRWTTRRWTTRIVTMRRRPTRVTRWTVRWAGWLVAAGTIRVALRLGVATAGVGTTVPLVTLPLARASPVVATECRPSTPLPRIRRQEPTSRRCGVLPCARRVLLLQSRFWGFRAGQPSSGLAPHLPR